MSSRPVDLPVAERWFAFDQLGGGVIRITEPHVHELLQSNAFLIAGGSHDLLIDACLGVVSLRRALEAAGLIHRRVIALATHSHYDHIGSMHEFEERLIHEAEADEMAQASDDGTLWGADFPQVFRDASAEAGMPIPDLLITAVPYAGYDPRDYRLSPAPATQLLAEGDTIDLGTRSFSVLHLPGHSPGGIGLFDSEASVLFAGDAIYDGPLLDEHLPGADIGEYVTTMRRLKQLSPDVVHGGHNESFGPQRLEEIADDYLRRRDGAT